MAEPLRRPELFVPLSVRFLTGRTGTRLLEEFGRDGPLVWAAYLAACKLNRPEGEISYASEAEGWALLGLQDHAPDFALSDFFALTGKLRKTRRTRIGRITNVKNQAWERWSKTAKRETERERKARNRAQTERDIPGTSLGHRVGQERDLEGEGEREVSKGRVLTAGPPRAPARGQADQATERNGLPFAKELIILRLVAWVEAGTDKDEGTPTVIRSQAGKLSEGALAKVLESCEQKPRIRRRASYAVGALVSERSDRPPPSEPEPRYIPDDSGHPT